MSVPWGKTTVTRSVPILRGATSAAVVSGTGSPGSHAAKVSEEGEGN